LRIRFLPYNTTVGDVQELCRRFGTTTSIELNKSVALANFSKQSEALLAIYTLEASQFRGNTLRVDFAREPREQKKTRTHNPKSRSTTNPTTTTTKKYASTRSRKS
jgi:RNA recognition motif-containing protein